MADTGAPWNLPYPLGTDLVKDGAQAIQDLAEAAATGLNAAGGLVAVKSALFSGTQTNSTAAGANFAVTSLSITHAVADASNKLIISAFFGSAATSDSQGTVGLAIHDGTGLIAIGDAVGSRTRLTSGGLTFAGTDARITTMPSVTFVHTPGAGSKTYTVRAINIDESTRTIYINRTQDDSNRGGRQRAVSSLVIQEVKV
jgi:hypothetical protein